MRDGNFINRHTLDEGTYYQLLESLLVLLLLRVVEEGGIGGTTKWKINFDTQPQKISPFFAAAAQTTGTLLLTNQPNTHPPLKYVHMYHSNWHQRSAASLTPMMAFSSLTVICFARSTAWCTCCWCSCAKNGNSWLISAFNRFTISVCKWEWRRDNVIKKLLPHYDYLKHQQPNEQIGVVFGIPSFLPQ